MQNGFSRIVKPQFLIDSVVSIDYIIPIFKGGKDVYLNLQLFHKHCYITKTRNDNFQVKKITSSKLCRNKQA